MFEPATPIVVAAATIKVARREFMTRPIIESRLWPVTMRRPWKKIQIVIRISAAHSPVRAPNIRAASR